MQSNAEELKKLAIWNKANIVFGYNANQYRKDKFGYWIAFSEYGKTTEYGWEFDHIRPVSLLGGDTIDNLQPLHWKNNRSKSNRFVG